MDDVLSSTHAEGMRIIGVYYTIDDGRTITCARGEMKITAKLSKARIRLMDAEKTLRIQELTSRNFIQALTHGYDHYIGLRSVGSEVRIIVITLFGSKAAAESWVTRRQYEYAKQRPVIKLA